LALRADYRLRARKAHAARAAKRTDSKFLKRRASIPQNRTLGCEDRAESHAQLQDFIHAAQDAIVLAGNRLIAVERALQEQVLVLGGHMCSLGDHFQFLSLTTRLRSRHQRAHVLRGGIAAIISTFPSMFIVLSDAS
jgi:hypothetical protein